MHKQKKIDAGYVRSEQAEETISSGCHGMGVYEKAPKKNTIELGKAAKFYKLADDPEACHETKVDHVVSQLERGI